MHYEVSSLPTEAHSEATVIRYEVSPQFPPQLDTNKETDLSLRPSDSASKHHSSDISVAMSE